MVTVNNLNIEDNVNYLVEEVTYRSVPNRGQQTNSVSRRPKTKLTANEWQYKEIEIKGRVFGTSPSDMRNYLDTLQQNFAVPSLTLAIDTDRSYTATLESLDIPTQHFNNSMIQYDAKFIATDPFAYAGLVTASGTVVSGTVTYSGSITVSGTVFAEPLLTINPTGANSGNSGINALKYTHVPTGETMTVSGTFSYSSPLVIDFNNFLVTNSGVSSDFTGIFSRFEPGVTPYTITVSSGIHNGFNYSWSYQPRYY